MNFGKSFIKNDKACPPPFPNLEIISPQGMKGGGGEVIQKNIHFWLITCSGAARSEPALDRVQSCSSSEYASVTFKHVFYNRFVYFRIRIYLFRGTCQIKGFHARLIH